MNTQYTETFDESGAKYLWSAITALELCKAGYNGSVVEMIDCLEMSMEEDISSGGVSHWAGSIRNEIRAYKLESPEDFK